MKKEFYRRNLPHYQPLGGEFFVTYNLADAIPLKVLKEWNKELEVKRKSIMLFSKNQEEDLEKLEKLDFAKRDKYLDSAVSGEKLLCNDNLARIVAESLHYWDTKILDLIAYCIMSNHVHVVFRLYNENELDKPKYLEEVMHSIKRYSANKCNSVLLKSGKFWQHESYDRLVRNENELFRIILYIAQNPVKAGITESPLEYKWTYISDRFKNLI